MSIVSVNMAACRQIVVYPSVERSSDWTWIDRSRWLAAGRRTRLVRRKNEGCLHMVPKPYCVSTERCEQLVVTASSQGGGRGAHLDGTSLIQS